MESSILDVNNDLHGLSGTHNSAQTVSAKSDSMDSVSPNESNTIVTSNIGTSKDDGESTNSTEDNEDIAYPKVDRKSSESIIIVLDRLNVPIQVVNGHSLAFLTNDDICGPTRNQCFTVPIGR